MPCSSVSSFGYKRYVLGLLTIILLFNSLDRIALGIILQAIKLDFALSDTQLGLLTGMAFALFYSVMGLPIGRWADTGNRVTVISLACAMWSAAVALCGVAGSFMQLLVIRVVVGVGEAGCVPPAFSLIADYFTRAERPRAVAIYVLGGSLSAVVGYSLAGWLNDHYGWRMTFMVLGAPGMLIGLIAWLTLKEPRLEARPGMRPAAVSQPTIGAVWVTLSTNVTFRRLLLCLSGLLFFNVGLATWMPAFFIRTHALTSEQVGLWLAMVVGLGGLPGAYVGGELAARYAVNNESLQLKAVTVSLCCAGVAAIFAYMASNVYVAFALLCLHTFAIYAINGPLFATMQTLIPERMRAMAFALAYLVGNLVGLGFGPIAAGALSDLYRDWAHEDSLRYALLTLSPGYFLVAWYAWKGSATVTADIALVSADGEIGSGSSSAANHGDEPMRPAGLYN